LPSIGSPGIFHSTSKKELTRNADSLNALIANCDVEELQELPVKMRDYLKESISKLEIIKAIRDSIIHKGKEPIVEIKKDNIFLRIPTKAPYGSENALPDILHLGNTDYPLIPYLRELTVSLFDFTENIGGFLLEELSKQEGYLLDLTALVGICIEPFNEFLNVRRVEGEF
jgi:hypothetical protein